MPRQRQTYAYIDDWKRMWEPDLEAIAYNGATCDPTRVDPKVLDWVKENCAHKPHFIKIINRNAANGRPGLLQRNACSLTVPSPFVREHFRELERVITLENGDGRTWRVSFGAPKRDPSWLQGWDRVATDNNLKPGDVVVFVLVGNSRFHFTHFDEDGSNISGRSSNSGSQSHQGDPSVNASNPEDQPHPQTKKRPLATEKNRFAEEGENEEQDQLPGASTDVEPIAEPSSCKARRLHTHMEEGSTSKEPKCGAGSGDSQPSSPVAMAAKTPPPFDPLAFTFKSKRRVTTAVERQRAEDAAAAHAQVLTEHHFVAVMAETHVYRDFHLMLPDRFVAEFSLPTSATRLKLVDCAGTSWDMCSKKNKLNQVAFHRKFWALFALHHLLEEGDVCVFQLKRNEARTLLVHIFRVVPISKVGRSSVHDHYEMQEIHEL